MAVMHKTKKLSKMNAFRAKASWHKVGVDYMKVETTSHAISIGKLDKIHEFCHLGVGRRGWFGSILKSCINSRALTLGLLLCLHSLVHATSCVNAFTSEIEKGWPIFGSHLGQGFEIIPQNEVIIIIEESRDLHDGGL